MASNYTEHYQLPIWAPDDSFLREEFNESHQKIDAALSGNMHLFPLCQTTLEQDTTDWEISFPSQQLLGTLALRLYGSIAIDDSVDCDRIYLRINGASSGYVGTNSSQNYLLCFQGASMAGAMTVFQAEITGMAALDLPGMNAYCLAAHGVSACTMRYPKTCESSGMMSLSKENSVTSLNLTASGGNSIKAGSRIVLMGVRW